MKNPTEIDFADYFLGSRWRKTEPEVLAKCIVNLAKIGGEWMWFTKEALLEETRVTPWELSWIDDLVNDGSLVFENGAYFPTEKFLSAGRTGGNRNWWAEDDAAGISRLARRSW